MNLNQINFSKLIIFNQNHNNEQSFIQNLQSEEQSLLKKEIKNSLNGARAD